MHGVKGIGFELEDGSDYEGKYGLMYHGRVDRENVEMIQYYKDNPVIQKALDALEQYCETSADKSVERQQETNRKKNKRAFIKDFIDRSLFVVPKFSTERIYYGNNVIEIKRIIPTNN